ncbi:MAG: carbonic anhydrase family protein [Thauera sp.]|nr:carbonic anhydrase family protein [Thauera sp.]
MSARNNLSVTLSSILLAAGLLSGGIPAASAADWQLVLSDRTRRVEIDRSSIFSSDPGTRVAWGRVVLSDSEAASQGFAMIKALNRYDCQNRTFLTVKRVYVDAEDHLIREESLDDSQQPVRPAANSVDERMWREVCRPGGSSSTQPAQGTELHRVASEIQRLVAAMDAGDRSQFAPDPAPSVQRAQPVVQPVVQPAPRPAPRAVTPAVAAPALPAVPVPPPVVAVAPAQADPIADLLDEGRVVPVLAEVEVHAIPDRSVPALDGWSYDGDTGPAAWGTLRPEWAQCGKGLRQAPVDLSGSLPVALEPLQLFYQRSGMQVRDRGHSLEVHITEGMGMEVRGVRYVLESFTLHRPAPEDAARMGHDLAVYFHHRSVDGQAAVLLVPLRVGPAANPLLDVVLANLPLERGGSYTPEAIIDLGAFIPAGDAYYLYMGSLPTPPCSEGVLWVEMKAAQTMSAGQLELLSRLHPPNARPLQAAHGRLILESR